MEWLNYQHLLYFWAVAKEGSVAQASRELRLAHPTISAQIHRLEEVLGDKLFERKGLNLVMTEVGRLAFRYADEIFSLGREFLDTVKGRSKSGRPIRVVVGCSDTLSKSIVHRTLAPAWRLEEHVRARGARSGCLSRRQLDGGVSRRAGHERHRRLPLGCARGTGDVRPGVQPSTR